MGSGSLFAIEAYEKIKFQMKRHNEEIADHLTPEEVIRYMLKTASICDIFTNDIFCFASFKKPDEEVYACIPSECESVERVIGSM